jgi:hypothetical protein
VGCRKTMVYSSENKYNGAGSFTPHHNNHNTYEIERVKSREENKNLMKAFIDAVHHKK